jgi:putative iron-regulated protein
MILTFTIIFIRLPHMVRFRTLLPFVLFTTLACSSDNQSPKPTSFPLATAEQALANYRKNTLAEYTQCAADARSLKAAIDAFTASPSSSTLAGAKSAWIATRVRYAPSEAHRFYEGPIDNEESGVEGRINAWPLDEVAIDYTRDTAASGLVNDLTQEITKQVIVTENEKAGEKAVTVGFHAIEFLLWGQDDLTPGTGPGKRPFTDFVDGGTASNQARRRKYLTLASELLVDDIDAVRTSWESEKPDSFGASFGTGKNGGATAEQATKKLLQALASLARAELSGERMTVAFKNRSQEDEHSCFSDTTSSDIAGNARGIENVWLGRYAQNDGIGLDEVVASANPALAKQITASIADAVAKTQALEALQNADKPFDVLLAKADGSPERQAVIDAIVALKKVATDFVSGGTALGLELEVEKPSEEL